MYLFEIFKKCKEIKYEIFFSYVDISLLDNESFL